MKTALIICGVMLAVLTGCATHKHATLYDELGGQQGIHHVVGRLIAEIGNDGEIRPFFAKVNLKRFYNRFSQYICQVADGPCKYTGLSMVDSHVGMYIDEAQFNRVVEMLIRAMTDERIATTTQNRLLARLAPARKQIIHE